ncbi:MAG: DUF255 domain-containing protein, partial [Flavobacterium sp.]
NSQILNPVKWSTRVEKISETEFNLVFEGDLDPEWHLYSQFTPDGGPIPLEIAFKEASGNFQLIGKAVESKTKTAFNDVFGVNEIFFSDYFTVKQKVKIINLKLTNIDSEVDYQVCKEVCINGNKKLKFDLPKIVASKVEVAATIDETKNNIDTISIVPIADTVAKEITAVSEVKADQSKAEEKEDDATDPLTIFLGTLLAGVLVTFTPCVFPMIPMTVSFFIKQNANKTRGKFNAIFYGVCIVAIYVLISVPFHLFESLNPGIFSDISTNVYLNIFFFIVFVIFAASFLGAFEITMPNSIANKADNASNLSGLVGVFFMALTLIIVSFSCTGPALGLILGSVLSTEGGAILLTIAMLGFGLGLAMPFMIFALFPRLMNNMPKSGGWLNSVKVVFGFIELALAFKFLSNADLVLQLHYLEREVFIAIWIAIFGALALYLFGKLTLSHDSPLTHLSVGRLSLALLVASFTIYLIPGLWGAPLKLISGFPPPMTYSESPDGFGVSEKSSIEELPDGAKLAVHDIVAFDDYEEGLAYAKAVNKPILLDFTGHACVNCRKMEEFVWSDPKVLEILKKDVVLISLYCDDRRELPENEKFVTKTGDEIETIGEKWSNFQIEKYASNARPLYVLLDTNENKLNKPVAYEPNVDVYLNWLKDGLKNFKK